MSESLGTPSFVVRMLHNNFRNPLGVLAIAGLDVLPLCVYARAPLVEPLLARWLVALVRASTGLLLAGRCCALLAELHFIRAHVVALAQAA